MANIEQCPDPDKTILFKDGKAPTYSLSLEDKKKGLISTVITLKKNSNLGCATFLARYLKQTMQFPEAYNPTLEQLTSTISLIYNKTITHHKGYSSKYKWKDAVDIKICFIHFNQDMEVMGATVSINHPMKTLFERCLEDRDITFSTFYICH